MELELPGLRGQVPHEGARGALVVHAADEPPICEGGHGVPGGVQAVCGLLEGERQAVETVVLIVIIILFY